MPTTRRTTPTSILRTGLSCVKLLDRKSRLQLVLLAFAILIGTGLETAGLALVFPLLQHIVSPGDTGSFALLDELMALLPESASWTPGAIVIVIAMAGLYAIKNLVLLFVTYVQFTIVFINERNFACRLYDSYLGRPLYEMLDRNSADLIRNVREVVATAFKGVIMGFINVTIEILMIVTILTVLILVQPYSALVAVIILVPGIALYQLMTRSIIYRLGVEELAAMRDIIKAIQEGMHSLKSTKVFGREDYFGERFRKAKGKAAKLAIMSNILQQTPRLWFETLIIATAACIVIVLLTTTSTEEATPALGLFAVAMLRLMPSINRMSMALNAIRNGAAALETLETEYVEGASYTHAAVGLKDDETIDPFDSIAFEDVTFTYPSKNDASLEHVSLVIKAGETVAIVGPSGAGKTTVADLLLGLLQPTSGRVLINGINLPDVQQQWRNMVAYVPQQVYVSDDSLRRNVAFAMPDNSIDDARVKTALREARIDHLLTSLPGRLDTPLGEQGRSLSVGQQQRIGIARALYDEPEFLVLDEATSALDVETENEITSVTSALAGKLTLIIIAHRLSTVRNADRIILMRDGSIVDVGSFDDLLENNEGFARMVNLAKL